MNTSYDNLLVRLNNDKAKQFIPAISFVGILMLFGTFGNSLVFYFYRVKTKPSPSTTFILALAVFDLISCVIGMPMEITDLRYYFNFKSEPACKILRCVTHFASISSGLTLTVIAIDRYRRICEPFSRQLNSKHAKVICVITGIVSVLLSWPAILFNEVVDVQVPNTNNETVLGKDCTITKKESLKPYMLAFDVILGVGFLIITIILAVLYSFISRQLFKHKKFRSYVATHTTKVRRINVRSKTSSEENLLPPRESTTLSNKVFEDPPDATGSVVDMRDYITRGLTKAGQDRPTSGYTAVTGTTGLTTLTDISGRSKRTLHSTKSVTICDPSKNEIFPVERRDKVARPSSSKTESTWMVIDDERPGSAGSFATFSSRPSSAAFSTFTEFQRGRRKLKFDEDDATTYKPERDCSDIAESNSEPEEAGEVDQEGMTNYKLFEHSIDGKTSVTIIEETSSKQNTFVESEDNNPNVTDNDKERSVTNIEVTPSKQNTFDESEDNNPDVTNNDKETSPSHIEDIDKLNTATTATNNLRFPASEENNDLIEIGRQDLGDTSVENRNSEVDKGQDLSKNRLNIETEQNQNETNTRPNSNQSVYSTKLRAARGRRRSNVVTPLSDVTITTSVASRASTVKRIRRVMRDKVFKDGKLNANTDKVKELRMKMLDINTIKYTVIMLAITILFVISFLPYLALITWRYFKVEHEVYLMSDTELLLFQIGVRSIFLNSSLNPLIYGGFNSKFRAFFYNCCCCCCYLCCCHSIKKQKKKKITGSQSRDNSLSTSGT